MNHYLVNLKVATPSSSDAVGCITNTQLIKATHSDKAIEIAHRNLAEYYCSTTSCKLVSTHDVSTLKLYLGL